MVNQLIKVSSATGVLRKNDVIIEIDGHPVALDGTILFRGQERISFDYVLLSKFKGGLT